MVDEDAERAREIQAVHRRAVLMLTSAAASPSSVSRKMHESSVYLLGPWE